MSLWGSQDLVSQSNTATASIVITAANSTVIGTNTKFTDDYAVGQYLNADSRDHVITVISNNEVMTVASANSSATGITDVSSNTAYYVSTKPKFATYSESRDSVSINGGTDNIYGVNDREVNYANNSESYAVSHSGWNRRTEGSGGRAGRVFYETLVAGGISGDAEDEKFPE